VYTFHIRQGVRFHNGNALTPSDVAYSFQRGILQGGYNSPQWLLAEPFLGIGIDDITGIVDNFASANNRESLMTNDPAVLLAACEQVKAAIVANDAAGTVTMTLAQPWGPFLVTIAQPWGSVMDKDWVAQNGGWNGSCDTWQNYYAMTSAEDPFTAIANGTGPFKLDHWMPNIEVSLLRNLHYWRGTPMWEGGPSGLANFEQVVIQNIQDEPTRYALLNNGDADMATLSSTYYSQLDSQVLFDYEQKDSVTGTLVHSDGTLNLYSGGLSPSADVVLFNYNIATGGSRNYIGSGALDGNGIPVNFFNDIHIRKAFNYAFNWTTYISNAFGGEAIQTRGPIISGLLGYTDTQPIYSYNPTLALQEFGQAWGGQVITHGFTLTISYNQGNTSRQALANILKSNIEALNPKFHINVLELPLSDYVIDLRSYYLPIMTAGWLQDIPHPHNWVEPYLLGTYAGRQRLPDAMKTIYQTKSNACLALTDTATAQTCYEDIQNTTYLDAVDIFLAQGYVRQYLRAEVRGHYINDSLFGPYFYALSKGPLPTIETVTPSLDQTVNFSSAQGSTAALDLPAGSVGQTIDIVVTPDTVTFGEPDGFHLGNLAFDIQAYVGGAPLPDFDFEHSVTLTLSYNTQATGSIIEEELRLFWWDGTAWVDAACGPYLQDTINNTLDVPICHLGEFAIGGLSHDVYLPLILR
jgi:peptide/nickel transport system substrate-binding protein